MELDLKRADHVVPDYSLTGDLLSFSRCELQYRYYNGSSLPPSRPVQLWYGEFIHGMMEAAYRLWSSSNGALPFPWPYTPIGDAGPREPPIDALPPNDIRMLAWPIEQTLAQEGKQARSRRARLAAYNRAERAINMLGPHLFPLISAAEQKVLGTRPLHSLDGTEPRSSRYALRGVIDVLGDVSPVAGEDNPIYAAIAEAAPGLEGEYEIIVDYKGARRPRVRGARADPHWELGEWQVQTYGWLRERQLEAKPVRAGILIYVNELSPSSSDLGELQREIRNNETDVRAPAGSPDYYQIEGWTTGTHAHLSEAFRLRRALRVIPVDEESKTRATASFDNMVARIERNVALEAERGHIGQAWLPTCDDRNTCSACDFLSFCPQPAQGSDPEVAVDDDEFA